MSIAMKTGRVQVKIGTTSWEVLSSNGSPKVGYVLFDSDFIYADDGITALMVWDAALNNVRAMTALEIAAVPTQKATARAQAAKAAATAGIDNGSLQVGDKFERMIVASVQAWMDEINVIRAAMPHPITSITRATTVATVTTPAAHGLVIGSAIAIMGADVAGYNLTTTVTTVPTTTTFTYTMANAGTTPAAGSLFYALGAVPQLPARTVAQIVAAIKAKIAATAE